MIEEDKKFLVEKSARRRCKEFYGENWGTLDQHQKQDCLDDPKKHVKGAAEPPVEPTKSKKARAFPVPGPDGGCPKVAVDSLEAYRFYAGPNKGKAVCLSAEEVKQISCEHPDWLNRGDPDVEIVAPGKYVNGECVCPDGFTKNDNDICVKCKDGAYWDKDFPGCMPCADADPDKYPEECKLRKRNPHRLNLSRKKINNMNIQAGYFL